MHIKTNIFQLLGALLFECIAIAPPSLAVTPSPVDAVIRTRLAPSFQIQMQNEIPQISDEKSKLHPTFLDPELQLHMDAYISERGSPIAGVVLVDIKTGRILTMSQGRSPDKWGSTTHTTLFNKFPAASLFKTVVTTAALEMTQTSPDQDFGLHGGCGGQDIAPTASWMNDSGGKPMNLRQAFGHSCNGFFAKLAINQLGIGAISKFARSFGWDSPLPVDIAMDFSKMHPPPVGNSTTHTVGRFAAGFGQVGFSPMHGAWIATMIANHGSPKSLSVLQDSIVQESDTPPEPIYSSDTSSRLMDVMRSTTHGNGTASHVFGRGRYREIADDVGGKTGTLNGRTPKGLTSLFIGVYPMSAPRIAVASVVVLEDRYLFKAPQLAAEAILAWKDQRERKAVIGK